jgi:hypothetical protein
MAPPVIALSSANPSDCPDLTPVDLTPFRDLFDPKNVPSTNLADPDLRTLLKTIDLYFRIDDKREGLGNGNELLEKEELDQFVANNRKILGPEVTACQLLAEARSFASHAPQLKVRFNPAPDSDPQGPTSNWSRADLIFHFLDQTSQHRFEQEKIDHAGPAGDSYIGQLVGWILFKEPWNKHFQETRPEQHKKERGQAIESLKKTMQEHPELQKVEEALSYCDEKTKGVLKKDLDIDRWTHVANAKTDLDRFRALDKLSDDYRAGKLPGFWDLNLVPCPRLGSGGWWDRAKHLKNWSWGKSPDLLLALAIDNYLGTEIPNTDRSDQEGRSLILVGQLSEADRKSFGEMMEKAAKGELSDMKAAETLLGKATLTKEGREDLLSRLRLAMKGGENVKLFKEVSALPFLAVLNPEDEKLKIINEVFGAVASGTLKAEAIETQLDLLEFSKEDTKGLQSYLRRVQVITPLSEDKGIDNLFHEAQLSDQEVRAREIFGKTNPTDAEKTEFKSILAKGKLLDENRQVLEFAFDHQEETRISQAAQKEFWDILGSPKKRINPSTGKEEWDPHSVGNLHNSLLVAMERGMGMGIFAAPMLIGSGLGYTISRLLNIKGLTPRWAAMAGGALGALFTLSPSADNLRTAGWEITQIPYRPWSDLAVADMPSEGLGLYVDLAASAIVTQGAIGMWRSFGATRSVTPSFLRLIEKGAVYGVANWIGVSMAVQGDDLWRPPTPLIPPFSESFFKESSPSDLLQGGTFL